MGSSRRSPSIKSRSGRHQRSPPSADDTHSRKKRRPSSSSSSTSDSESGSDTDLQMSSKKLQMSSSGKRSSDVRSSTKDDKRKGRRDFDSGSSSDDSEPSPVKGKTAGSRGGESSRLRELISKRRTAVKNTHESFSSESESESDSEDRRSAKRPDKKSSVSRGKQPDLRRPMSRNVSPRVSKADHRRKELRKSSSSDSSESESADNLVPDYSRRKKEGSMGRGSGRKGEVPSRNREKESATGVVSKSSKSSSSRRERSENDRSRRLSSERRGAPRSEATRRSGRREESGSRRRRDPSDSPEDNSSKRMGSRHQYRENFARSDGRRDESGSGRRRDLSDSPECQSSKGRSSRRHAKGSDSERKRDKGSTRGRSSGSRVETGSKRRRNHAGSSEDASSKGRSSYRQNRGSDSERKRDLGSTQARSFGNRGESGSRRRKDSSDSSDGASREVKSSRRQNKGSGPDRKRDKASTKERSSGSRVESGSRRRKASACSPEDSSPGGRSSHRQNKRSDTERKSEQTSTKARLSGSRGQSGLRRRKDPADFSEDAPLVERSSHRRNKGSDSERKLERDSTQTRSSRGRIESSSRRRKDRSNTPVGDARGFDNPEKLKRDEQHTSGKSKDSSHRPQRSGSHKRHSEGSSSEDDGRRRRAAGSKKRSGYRHDGSEDRGKRMRGILHKQKDDVACPKHTSLDDSTSEGELRRDAQSDTGSDRPRQVRESPSEGVKVAGRRQDTLKRRSTSLSSSEAEALSADERGDCGEENKVSPSRARPPVQESISPEVALRGLQVFEEPAGDASSSSRRSTGSADGNDDANVEAVVGRQRHDTSESDSSDVVGVRSVEIEKVTRAEESASDSGAAESHDEDAGVAGLKVDTVRSKVVVSGGGLPLPTADEGTEQKVEEHRNSTPEEEGCRHRSPAGGSEKGGGGSVSPATDRPKMRSEIGGRAAVVEDLRQKVGDAAENEESTSGEEADVDSRSPTPLSSPESPEVHHSTGNLGRETMCSTVVVNKPSGNKVTDDSAGGGRSDERRRHSDDGEDDAERRGSKRSGRNTADDARGSRGRRPGDKKRTSSPFAGDSRKRQRGQRNSPDRQAYWSRAADSDEAAGQRDYDEGGRSPDHYWRREPFQRRPADERYSEDLKRYAASQGDRKRRRSHEDGEERPRERRGSGAAEKDVGAKAAADKTADKMPGGVSAAEMLTTRTGGAYIPPARLRMMQEQITDKSSAAYQRLAWEALKKSLNGFINKVNVSNLVIIVQELLQENVVRGRGLLCRALLQAQAASPTFTHVYAALVAVINTKFPQIGELLLHRLVLQFKRGFRRNDKPNCLAACRFVAHLVNQQVAHEVLALEILTLLLENPTDDSVEVSIGFLQEVGQKLTELSPRGVGAIFERLRHILHEAKLDKRVQYMIEVMFAVRKDGFKSYPSLIEELDIVEEDDQFTHLLTLDEVTQSQEMLNVFRLDPDYEANEEKYATIRREVLGDSGGSDDGSGSEEDASADEGGEDDTAPIVDTTESNLLSLRKTIYLTIRSSLDFEETAHKLLKLKLKPGQEPELCHMFLDCCAQERTFEKFYGLLAERFCVLDRKYRDPMEQIFSDTYDTVHRLETSKLRNVAKLFGHLLNSDAISWGVLQHCRLNEEDTNSSSRIFIKILFQELSEFMGLARLNERVNDVHLGPAFEGLFPRDNPKNTRFAINFFTSIGLGGLTDGLRDHLKSQPKPMAVVAPTVGGAAASKEKPSNNTSGISTSDVAAPATRRAGPPAASDSSSSSSSLSSSDSSSESSESSSSDSESDESERRRQKKKSRKKRSRKSKKSAQPSKKAKSDGKQEAGRKEKSSSSRSKQDRPGKQRTNKSSRSSRRR